jgi:DNA-directed RNA polymerase specialized sigma24 family protein
VDSSRTEPQNARAESRDMDQLVAALRRGDGYCEFRKIFLPHILAYLYRLGVSAFEAEDIAESCVTDTALKAQGDQPGGLTLKTCVARSVERLAAQWYRTSARDRGMLATLTLERRQRETIDWGRGHESTAERPSPCVDAIREALQQLSEEDRTIVESRQRDIPIQFHDLAVTFGISAGTARTRYHRALNRLRLLVSSDPRIAPALARTPVDALSNTVCWDHRADMGN